METDLNNSNLEEHLDSGADKKVEPIYKLSRWRWMQLFI